MNPGSNVSILNSGFNIFLLGFMGSGKTHWGRLWAERYAMNFVDLDELIEKEQGTSVAHLFDTFGEEHFRRLERAALRSCSDLKNTIIACGGGTPCFFDNMEWLRTHGITIYLACDPAEILRRVSLEQEKRPLFSKLNPGELLEFIVQKSAERQPFYNQADFKLDCTEVTENTLTFLDSPAAIK